MDSDRRLPNSVCGYYAKIPILSYLTVASATVPEISLETEKRVVQKLDEKFA